MNRSDAMANGDWNEVFEEVEAEYFVGREQELESFHQNIRLSKPRFLIFYITGQGGVGKSTLLNRCKEIAQGFGFLLADCDEQQHDVPSVLGRFAQQLTEQGFPLRDFNERYKTYRQKMHEIENDPEAPQGLAATLTRTLVRAAFIGGDAVPGIRKGLEFVPREIVETQASEWATYLTKKFSNKDEVALMRDPVPNLTPLFFKDINEIAQKRRVLLCFDNFEAATPELLQWFLRVREYKPSLSIRIIIAGRNKAGTKWDTLRKVTLPIRLDVFTEREAEAFLDAFGISDFSRRREILEYSGRLPVLMSWLSAPEGQEPDHAVPTHDIVERFLRWVPELVLRRAALLAAIPHSFNLDVLKLLLNDSDHSFDVQSIFDWLLTMPFVQQRSDGWYYHSVVRRLMLRYQRQKSPSTYQDMHTKLAEYYNTVRYELSSSIEKEWTNEEWRAHTLAYAYHFLVADYVHHWDEIISLFAVALRKRRSFAVEIIELLSSEDIHDELSHELNDEVQLFRQQLEAIEKGDLKDGFKMFNKLCAVPGLSSQAKCYVFAYRGEGYRQSDKWEKALGDFEKALYYISDDAWAIGSRGQTYRSMEQYKEALADFNRAIELDEEYDWAIAQRGGTYNLMERYEEALADFNRAIELDEKNALVVALRGETYRFMKRYEEALVDFNRAIELDETMAPVIALRGETYRFMKRYEEALVDFDRAIALDEKDAWAIGSRGQTYRLMKRYEEALVDFNRAIELDEEYDWAIAQRGETYRLMERYEEALVDFDRAIELDEEYAWAIGRRGETYRLMKRYEEALVNFNRAIALDEEYAWAIGSRGQTYRLMKRYEEALVDFDRAIAVNETMAWAIAQRGETYRLMKRYEEALVDFDRAIALDEKYAWAIAQRGETYRLMKRYEEALVDFNRAIELDEEYDWAIAQRGETYRLMERYEEALVDFDRAIELDEEYDWAIAQRGETYRLMKRYEEALVNFNRAIALDEEYAWAIGSRGQTYRLMKRYEEALVDFDRAIAVNETMAWAIAQRGETYRLMKRYEEALVDFDRAIALDEKYAWAIAQRGETYRLMKRYEEALV